MQKNASKYKNIIIFLLALLPIGISAQTNSETPRKKYVSRNGDTTLIVLAGSTGLYSEEAAFLRTQRATVDQLARQTRYRELKEAVQETNQVAEVIYVEKERTNLSSGSLGFRASQKNIDYLQKEELAKRAARQSIINKDASLEELTFMYEKYGGKPSYFVNGTPITPQVAASIGPGDILTRSLKSSNTTTGNPNGEVWLVVNTKIYDKIDTGAAESSVYYADSNTSNTSIYQEHEAAVKPIEHPQPQKINPEDLLTPEQKRYREQQRQVEALKREIEAMQLQRTGRQASVASSAIHQAQPSQQSYSQQEAASSRNPIPNRYANQQAEIVSFRDSPQEKARREREQQGQNFSLYGDVDGGTSTQTQGTSAGQSEFTDSSITQETPTRSVRRIKERQRNR